MRTSYLLISILLTLVSCATGSKPIPIVFDPLSPTLVVDGGYVRDQAALAQYLKKHTGDQDLVADASLILDAMTLERAGDQDKAIATWYKALETASGPFGEKAFNGWLKAFVKKRGKVTERAELARVILAETNGGTVGPWMIDRGIQTEQKIIPILQRDVPDWLEGEVIATDAKLDAPQITGVNPADPLMTKLAGDVCKYKSRFGAGWDKWRKALSGDVARYFDALVLQCGGQSAKALDVFSDVAPRLASGTGTAPFALESYARSIKIRRDQGERESVAPLYLPFMEVWKSPAISESSLGLSRNQFEQRRIDDTLWAARARASVGDSEAAKIFAEDVLNYVGGALTQSYTLSPEQKSNLAATAAETYHLLAFRLAVEAQDWEKAFNIASLAQEQSQLPDEWKFRLQWSQGLYRYLAGDYEASRLIWETLLTDSTDEKMRPALLFWASRAHEKLGNASEVAFYRKSLSEDFPLNFYSVVGLKLTPGDFQEHWTDQFKNINDLRNSVLDWQKEDIDDLRMDGRRGRLLRRAEIFASLSMTQFAAMALDEVQKSFDPLNGGDREAAWGLYLSRLYGASGNWLGSITVTTKLSKDPEFWRKHPEQMLVYFPRPYVDIYRSVASEFKLDPNVLMGISRQESSFRTDVKSGANAWGLMQVTPPTARRLLPAAGFPADQSVQIPEALLRPDANIRFGATFVRELSASFPQNHAALFAAYNAGPLTVENWVARRIFDDPLIFIEMIPYQETRDYVKGVWRNELVYGYLAKEAP